MTELVEHVCLIKVALYDENAEVGSPITFGFINFSNEKATIVNTIKEANFIGEINAVEFIESNNREGSLFIIRLQKNDNVFITFEGGDERMYLKRNVDSDVYRKECGTVGACIFKRVNALNLIKDRKIQGANVGVAILDDSVVKISN